MAMSDKDISDLVELVDRYEFWEILEGLAEICLAKKASLYKRGQIMWGFEEQAKVWHKMSTRFADMAEKLK